MLWRVFFLIFLKNFITRLLPGGYPVPGFQIKGYTRTQPGPGIAIPGTGLEPEIHYLLQHYFGKDFSRQNGPEKSLPKSLGKQT